VDKEGELMAHRHYIRIFTELFCNLCAIQPVRGHDVRRFCHSQALRCRMKYLAPTPVVGTLFRKSAWTLGVALRVKDVFVRWESRRSLSAAKAVRHP